MKDNNKLIPSTQNNLVQKVNTSIAITNKLIDESKRKLEKNDLKKGPEYRFNDCTGEWELKLDSEILKVPKKVFELKNDSKTPYRILTVIATMPDGTKQKCFTLVWESLVEQNDYIPGDEITLAVKIKGEFKGYSRIHIAGVSKLYKVEWDSTPGIASNIQDLNLFI